jgi:hypothetical protein
MKTNVLKLKNVIATATLTILAVAAFSGCSSDGGANNATTGAVTGGLFGAATGAIIGNAVGHRAGEGALIGAAGGALLGGLAGHAADQSQQAQLRQQQLNEQPPSAPSGTPPGAAPAPQAAPQDEPDVKALAKSGLDDDAIIAQIVNSQAVYHLSADEIIDLHNAGVSQKVIDFMVKTQNTTAATPPSATDTAPAPTPAPAMEPAAPQGNPDVKALAKSGLDDDAIIAQIVNSQAVYHLSADDIIALHNEGVSQKVIDFMIKTQNTNPAAPAPSVDPTR